MRFLLLCLLASPLVLGHIPYSPAALKDEITHLPDAPAIKTKMFSGYIPVGRPEDERAIFYWFFEAQQDAEHAPLVLWTNGGPGCSSCEGMGTENLSPFSPAENGTHLTLNDKSWNSIANMIFFEQPAGVGFSYTKKKMSYGDAQAAADNYDFIVAFMKKFEYFQKADFFLASESYGGHYLPTLAYELVQRGGVPNFKGFMVGNPLTYLPYRDFGQYGTFYGHQLLPLPLWKDFEANDCAKAETSPKCQDIVNQMNTITAGLDPYALDFPVCGTALQAGREERKVLMNSIARAHGDPDSIVSYFPSHYDACRDNWLATYLNRKDVQEAIHVVPTTWEECNMDVNTNYNTTDIAAPMMPVYKALVEGGYNLRIMVYSGDDDSICSTMGTQQFVWDLGFNITTPWHSWKVDDQIAGYSTSFQGLQFVTVHGAGHMVPATRPEQAFQLFYNFIHGLEF